MVKLAIITTHPIQYNAPLFQLLQKRDKISIKVFYTWGDSVLKNKYDPGFKKKINWDIPLLEGYNYEFVENISSEPGSHHYSGIQNPGLVAAIKNWGATAVLVYGWPFQSHLGVMKYFKNKIPVLFRGDSTNLDKESILKKLGRKIILKYVYKHIDYAFYTGSNNKKYYKTYGVPSSKLIYAPHAIDNDRFQDVRSIGNIDFRNQLNIPIGDFVFLFSGKIESKKDPVLFCNAFKNAKLGPNVHLVIVGSGPLEKVLKGLYATYPNFHFLPFQNQLAMPAVYNMADVFVLPSKGPGETWGLAVNEALATGVPVLVSDKCGCAADIVIEGKNGYIFKAGNEKDLINKMGKIKDDGGKKTMSLFCREYIKRFSFLTIAIQIENLLVPRVAIKKEDGIAVFIEK